MKPFRGNNNINNDIFHTKKNVQFKTSNKYLLFIIIIIYYINKAYDNVVRYILYDMHHCIHISESK